MLKTPGLLILGGRVCWLKGNVPLLKKFFYLYLLVKKQKIAHTHTHTCVHMCTASRWNFAIQAVLEVCVWALHFCVVR